ncbi:MAG: hypothetical protein ACO1PI_10250 [Bacteroidota bacterium]
MFARIDWKYIGVLILLFVVATIGYTYKNNISEGIKVFFEIPGLNIIAGGIAAIVTLTKRIKTRKFNFNKNLSFEQFQKPFEDFVGFIGNPLTLGCSLTLAKGLYLQQTKTTQYFPFFESYELAFIVTVTFYLIYTSLLVLISNVRDIIFKSTVPIQHPQAIPSDEVNAEIPTPQ